MVLFVFYGSQVRELNEAGLCDRALRVPVFLFVKGCQLKIITIMFLLNTDFYTKIENLDI